MQDFNGPVEAAKIAPPATVATLSAIGVTIPDLIQVFTLIYIVGMCIQLGYRAWRWIKSRRAAEG